MKPIALGCAPGRENERVQAQLIIGWFSEESKRLYKLDEQMEMWFGLVSMRAG